VCARRRRRTAGRPRRRNRTGRERLNGIIRVGPGRGQFLLFRVAHSCLESQTDLARIPCIGRPTPARFLSDTKIFHVRKTPGGTTTRSGTRPFSVSSLIVRVGRGIWQRGTPVHEPARERASEPAGSLALTIRPPIHHPVGSRRLAEASRTDRGLRGEPASRQRQVRASGTALETASSPWRC